MTLAEQLAVHTAQSGLAETLEGGRLRCLACGHRCPIAPEHDGVCKVRFNRDGKLLAPRGYVNGIHCDPIEKKPFYHALPGSGALSFGMLGCDLHCGYCQNWISSQAIRDPRATGEFREMSAASIVGMARRAGASSVVSTYNEPLITAEWAVEVFREARGAGLVTGFVSNGNATPEVLEYLRPWLDLFKVDLKSFDDRRYRELGGRLQPVLDSIERIHKMGFWLEVVTLVVPGFNDSRAELGAIAGFLAGISRDIPWHVTAFHPDYKMNAPPRTPATTLFEAVRVGREAGLRYVYAGNLAGQGGENTHCPECGLMLIERFGFQVIRNRLDGGACPQCRTAIPGFWSAHAAGGRGIEAMMATHASPYAGSWYPGGRAELEPMLGRMFEESAKRTGAEMWPGAIAFVVPHAGLMYSGGVAAAAYRQMQAERPSRVFILGFCHRGGRGAVELPDIGAFQTPMGKVRIDVDAVRSLAGKAPFAMAQECDVCDHSVEIQLPLLQYAVPDAVVVPLYVGRLDEVKRRAAAEVLAGEFRQGDVLVASTDLTHYGREFGYLPFPADENAQDRISDLDHDAIEAAGSLDAALFLETLRESKATVCGYEPVALLLETLTALGGESIFQRELDYRTSAGISGDMRHSVSYAALAYFREESFEADAETQAALLESVRDTLSRLRRDEPGRPVVAAGESAELKRKPAVFVSLHQGKELFGCIGTRAKELTLAEAIPYLTHASADDPRFPRGRGIPEDLDIEVSILTPMKRVRDWRSFRLGVDGAYLIVDGRCGLLLPQVAGPGIDTAERFLECLSRKIGLPANAYRDREAKLSVFHAQVFGGHC